MRLTIAFMLALLALRETGFSAPRSLAEVAADGKLTIALTSRHSPFLYLREGRLGGFDAEVLEKLAAPFGMELQPFVVDDVGDLIPAVLSRRAELIAGGFTFTPERAAQVRFTEEVTPQRHIIVTLGPRPGLGSVRDLAGLRVGVAPGSSWTGAALSAGVTRDQLVDLPVSAASFLAAFREKRIDAAITGMFFAFAMASEDPSVRLGAFVGNTGYHAYAAHPDDGALIGALNQRLAKLRGTHLWYDMVREHFGERAHEFLKRTKSH